MSNGKRISVGPKMTVAALQASTGRLTPEPNQPGQPHQELDQHDPDHKINKWKYHYHLEPSWDNAAWAAQHDNSVTTSPYYGDKYFDRDGKKQNDEFKKAICAAFEKYKKPDKDGHQWLLAWRMYPNEDHPRWSTSGFEGCGCNCGCFCPKTGP